MMGLGTIHLHTDLLISQNRQVWRKIVNILCENLLLLDAVTVLGDRERRKILAFSGIYYYEISEDGILPVSLEYIHVWKIYRVLFMAIGIAVFNRILSFRVTRFSPKVSGV